MECLGCASSAAGAIGREVYSKDMGYWSMHAYGLARPGASPCSPGSREVKDIHFQNVEIAGPSYGDVVPAGALRRPLSVFEC